MKNNKGFTLVELLAVIVVLAIILAIALPGILGVISKSREDAYLRQKDMIIDVAKKYVTQFSTNMNWNNNTAIISLSNIQNEGLIDDPLKNPKGGIIDSATRIVITLADGTVNYDVSVTDELKYQFTPDNANANGASGTFKYKNGSNYYIGANPNNWIQFGQVSSSNSTPLLWRIIKSDEEGIKIIYEGVKNGVNAPTQNGVAFLSRWDSFGSNKNKWENSTTLYVDLANWWNNLYANEKNKYIKSINWCIGQAYNASGTTITDFKNNECKSQLLSSGDYLGLTTKQTSAGMILASDYLSTSGSALCSTVDNTNCGANNFLFKTSYWYWTITASGFSQSSVWIAFSEGYIGGYDAYYEGSVRPVINLKSNILYDTGAGTLASPYKIK